MKKIKLFEEFLNEEKFEWDIESPLIKSLKKEYNITDGENGSLKISVKDGKSFPWKLIKKDGKFKLYQEFSDRSYMKPKMYAKGTFDTEYEAYKKIIKNHNTSAKNPDMGWNIISEAASQGGFSINEAETADPKGPPFFIEATDKTLYKKLEKLGIMGNKEVPPPYIGATKDGTLWEVFMANRGNKKGWMVHSTSRKLKPEFLKKIFPNNT